MINKLGFYEETKSDYSFLKDIVKYSLDRFELEAGREENTYFHDAGAKSLVISCVCTLTINLFKRMTHPNSHESEIKMAKALMQDISHAVILAITEPQEDDNEQ